MKKEFFFIAGGKTGGHIFPGISIAQSLISLQSNLQPLFIGVKNGLEAELVPKNGFPVLFLPAYGFFGVSVKAKLKAIFFLPFCFFKAFWYIFRYQPKVVIGVGGFASFPMLLTAAICFFPTAIQEQNVVLGKANQILARWMRKIYLPLLPPHFPFSKKVKVVGNPIRREIHLLSTQKEEKRNAARSAFQFQIFIFGGSQGASFINECFLKAYPELILKIPNLFILHQTGKRDFERVKNFYEQKKAPAQVQIFVEDMASAYQKSHLILSRSGAGIYECNAAGRVGIYIPIRISSGDHQKKNALYQEEKNAGWCLEEKDASPQALQERILKFYTNPKLQKMMEENSRNLYLGDAALEIAKDVQRSFLM